MVAIERQTPPAGTAPTPDAIPITLRRRGGTSRQVLALTLVGTMVLAVFASRDLSSWLDRMGGGAVLVRLQQAAAEWDGAMNGIGLTRPHEALRHAVGRVLDRAW